MVTLAVSISESALQAEETGQVLHDMLERAREELRDCDEEDRGALQDELAAVQAVHEMASAVLTAAQGGQVMTSPDLEKLAKLISAAADRPYFIDHDATGYRLQVQVSPQGRHDAGGLKFVGPRLPAARLAVYLEGYLDGLHAAQYDEI